VAQRAGGCFGAVDTIVDGWQNIEFDVVEFVFVCFVGECVAVYAAADEFDSVR
jgi:hypothetical protein